MNPKQNITSTLKEKVELDSHSDSLKNQSTKVVSLNTEIKLQADEQQLTELLVDKSKSALFKVELFFEELFQNKELIFIDSKNFKHWQIKLSNAIRDGQDSFQFINTIAPMALAETLLVGYCGMVSRCQVTGRSDFFEIWLKTNRRIILA